jgi:hypothetical protein
MSDGNGKTKASTGGPGTTRQRDRWAMGSPTPPAPPTAELGTRQVCVCTCACVHVCAPARARHCVWVGGWVGVGGWVDRQSAAVLGPINLDRLGGFLEPSLDEGSAAKASDHGLSLQITGT